MQPDGEVISSIKHPAVVAARGSLARCGGRGPAAFLIDGAKMVAQALDACAPVEAVFLRDAEEEGSPAALAEQARRASVPCHRVSRGVFFRILGLGYETSVRVLALVRRPPGDTPMEVDARFCTVVGERIQDPRNVGVIVRTADAMGLTSAVFSADSADPYSRAAVRSTTGSIFRVRLTLSADLAGCLAELKAGGARVIGTSASAPADCRLADLRSPCAIVLGNESDGLSPEVAAACDELVTIPMYGGAHSLNVTVAAGILLYEWARQMTAWREGVSRSAEPRGETSQG